jgi:dihydropteroate synthase
LTADNYYSFAPRNWQLAHGRILELGPVSRIMGILNVTPDSFSDGGQFVDVSSAIDHAAEMFSQGADIADVGGETTKPGARPIDQTQEQDRILPVIGALKDRFEGIISVDTYRAATAQLAIEAGAHLVNDIGGFQFDENMAATVSGSKAGVCLMHNSRDRNVGEGLIADQLEYLSHSVAIAHDNDVDNSYIVLDPGFGFGKNVDENLTLLDKFNQLQSLGLPLLAGTSRKRFTGFVLGGDDTSQNRDIVTAATSVIARMAGCVVFRVHQVKTNKQALQLADAVLETRLGNRSDQ